MTTPVAKKLQKEEEISMADRIKNLVETIEQLKAALHRAMGALEFANSLVRVKEGKENDKG